MAAVKGAGAGFVHSNALFVTAKIRRQRWLRRPGSWVLNR